LQWYTNAKNMTDIPWGVLLGGLVVSKTAWEKIPADVRGKLEISARAAAAKLSRTTRDAEPRDIAAMQKHGLNVVKLDAAALAEWRKLVAETLPKLRGQYVPAEALDRVLAVRDACRAGGSR
jgi:TRAP-type C4-dicarboxylate transport system substrate-binding protein